MTAKHTPGPHSAEMLWFTSSSGRVELCMSLAQARSVSHPGPCDADVLELSREPAIAAQLARLDPDTLARELREYGAWDATELVDRAQNLQRILWLAAGSIVDEYLND